VFKGVTPSDRKDATSLAPIVTVNSTAVFPGGAANVAANLKAMGARVNLIALAGHDEAGAYIAGLTDVGEGLVLTEGRRTTTKTRYSSACRIDEVDIDPNWEESQAMAANIDEIANWADGVLVSDYGLGVTGSMPVCTRIGMLNVPVHLDPHRVLAPALFNRNVTCATPNTEEALVIASQVGGDWAKLLNPGCVNVTTRGPAGAVIHQPGDYEGETVATKPVDHPDVCGAGDVFAAALLLSRLGGALWADAVTIANAAGRAAVLKPFTSVVNQADVLAQIPHVLKAELEPEEA
jgi:bifunctional ADP-heptose synthase (sugar kinase/adenylyltransferase)